MKEFDVQIIGSGFGGLIAGAILAKNGLRVAVFEQHDKPGGFASHFKRKGFTFEVAVHLIEGPHKDNFRTRVFDYLGLENAVEFLKVPELFALHSDKDVFRLPADFDLAEAVLALRFPGEKEGVRSFFYIMKAVMEEATDLQLRRAFIGMENPLFSGFYPVTHSLLGRSVIDFMSSILKSAELRWILLCNMGFFHHDPSSYPAYHYLPNLARYFAGGARYVRGGMQGLSNALVHQIQAAGGELFLRHRAEKLLVEAGAVKGARYTALASGESFELRSRFSICNAPLPYAYRSLLSCEGGGPSNLFPSSATPSISATTLYLGLDRPIHAFIPGGYFNFFRQSEERAPRRLNEAGVEFSLVDYSYIDKGTQFPGRHTADLVYLDRFQNWPEPPGSDGYSERKIHVTNLLFQRLGDIHPDLPSSVRVAELATPHTIQRFTCNSDGAAYGFEPDSFRASEVSERISAYFRPEDPRFKGLFFASAWSTAHGISGTSMAGYQAARSLLETAGMSFDLAEGSGKK